MFTTKMILDIYRFMKNVKDKGQFVFLEYNEILEKHRLVVEFCIDDYDYMVKFIKDWIIFHTDIVDSYYIEINSDLVHFMINIRERSF